MSKLERYSSYKDSGVEWLGEIPIEWGLTRLGTKFIERKEKVSDKDYEPLSVTKNGIVPQLESAAKSNDGDNRKLVKKDDFVINSRSDRKGSSGISPLDGSVSLINIALEPQNINSDFCNYLLKSNGFIEEYYRNGHGIVADLWTTRFWDMKSIMLGIPPKQEQIKIASFLDTKTEQLDKAIKQKEQLIELLKERRAILINDAVTKGIDKTVAMKDSGVEWIGETPEHWEVKKMKYIFKFSKGLTITKDNLIDDGIKCVNYGEIHSKYGFEIDPEIHDLKCVDASYLKSDKKSLLNFGDFVYADTSEDMEGSGNFTYLNSNIKTFAGYHTVICRPKKEIDARFFAYEFDSSTFRYQLQRKVKGVKVYSITQGMLKDVTLWIPPLSEQQELVEILDKKTSKLDKTINLQEQQITKLKEYKTTLIDSVVTGKRRV